MSWNFTKLFKILIRILKTFTRILSNTGTLFIQKRYIRYNYLLRVIIIKCLLAYAFSVTNEKLLHNINFIFDKTNVNTKKLVLSMKLFHNNNYFKLIL